VTVSPAQYMFSSNKFTIELHLRILASPSTNVASLPHQFYVSDVFYHDIPTIWLYSSKFIRCLLLPTSSILTEIFSQDWSPLTLRALWICSEPFVISMEGIRNPPTIVIINLANLVGNDAKVISIEMMVSRLYMNNILLRNCKIPSGSTDPDRGASIHSAWLIG
jgi:hypothetical protein